MSESIINDSWDQAIEKLGLVVSEDIVFGTDAMPTGAQIAIRDLDTLADYFNPYADNCHWHKINSEGQAYMPYVTHNHVFGLDYLGLVADLDTGPHSAQPRVYCPVANAGQIAINNVWPPAAVTPMSAFAYPPGPAPERYQLVLLAYAGTYLIELGENGLLLCPWFGSKAAVESYTDSAAFLPVGAAWVERIEGNTLTVNTPLQSFVRPGMFCGVAGAADINWDASCTLLEVQDGNRLVLDRVPPGALYNWVVLMPPIRSAQIWRKHYPGVGFDGVTIQARRTVITLPDSKGGRNNFNAYSPPPPRAPIGSWPAVWEYSGTPFAGVPFDWSERDHAEWWLSKTQWFGQQSSNTHGPFVNDNGGMGATNIYLDENRCGSGSNPWMCNLNDGDLSGTPISVGMIQTEDKVYMYLNDVVWRAALFKWTSQQPPQFGCNHAYGSLKGPYGANLQWPFDDGAFPATFKIHRATQLLRK